MESSKPALKRKRRPAGECPNPLFVKWVEEWRDEAREEGSKVQYAYTRVQSLRNLVRYLEQSLLMPQALNSLKKYPLPLVSGQEAKILDHIGEKLAKKLDRRLAQHRVEEGIGENSGSGKRSKVTPPKAGESSRDLGDIQPTKVKKKRAQAEYVPEYRSGPYGIIIALYRAQQKPNWIGHLTKTQLMSQAQPFSDKSFTIPDDGKYYTAWSSMATLIRKGLVDKRSCPAKFRLTEAGEEMAEKLERATSTLTSTSPTATQSSSSSPSFSSTATIGRDRNVAEKERRGSSTQQSHSRVSHPMSPPAFSPSPPSLKSPNTPPATVLSAAPTIFLVSDSDDSSDIEILPPPLSDRIQTKTRPPRSLSLSSPTSPPPLSGVPPGPSSQRWSVEETPEHSGGVAGSGGRGGLTPAQMAGRAALCRLQASSSGGDGGGGGGGGERRVEEKNRAGGRRKAEEKARGKSKKNESKFSGRVDLTLEKEDLPVSKKRRESEDDEDLPDFPLLTKARPGRSTQTHRPTLTSPPPKSPPFHRSPTLSPSSPLSPNSRPALGDITASSSSKSLTTAFSNTTSTAATTVSKSQTRSPLFRLIPGEYEVVLCVDNAESTACRKSSSQFRGILLQELAKNGVRFDVRKLNVGDFLWIAKEKAAPLQGQLMLPQSREVVLEYIVERKRMDDLAGSITDKRFHEQKFRLRHCGVRQPMYLVEEFGDKIHLKLPVRSLEQAISNTQVIDGFTVHRTTDIRESVAYLTLLTRQLCRHYAGKTVEAFPWDTVSDLNKPPPLAGEVTGQTRGPSIATHLTDGATVLGMEFSSFNDASVKNKTLTAYEMFGRHLMQVPSVSAERAAAILDHFPTISALRDAYRKCDSSSKREALISSLKAGQTRSMGKNVGSTLSRLYWGQ